LEAGAHPAGEPSLRLGLTEGAPARLFDVVVVIPEPVARRSRPHRCLPPKARR